MAAFAMSKHALTRAVDMAIEAHEIRDAVERPRDTYYSARTDSTWLTRGRITVCMAVNSQGVNTVATVLWAKPSDCAVDAEFGDIEGRDTSDYGSARRAVRARKSRH